MKLLWRKTHATHLHVEQEQSVENQGAQPFVNVFLDTLEIHMSVDVIQNVRLTPIVRLRRHVPITNAWIRV